METQNIPEKPKSRRGAPKEVLAEIGKKGNETKKKQGVITKFEKQQKREQIEAKFKLVQEELAKREKQNEKPEPEPVLEPTPEQSPEPEPPTPEPEVEPMKVSKQRKQKVVEVVEEVEESSSEEEEEVIIKKVIKKVPKKRPEEKSIKELYQSSNEDMLRRKLFEDTRKRVMTDLFDY